MCFDSAMTAKVTRADFDERFTPEPMSGCWLWTGSLSPNGYGVFGGAGHKAHRASYEFHKGPIPHGLWVLHSCDNRACVNPAHLRTGTRRDNIDDMVKRKRNRGSKCRGVTNAAAKLKPDDVVAIARARADGETVSGIARRFGVSRCPVQRIIDGHGWRDVLR